MPTSEELSLTEVLDRFGEGIPGAGETFITPTEDWLK